MSQSKEEDIKTEVQSPEETGKIEETVSVEDEVEMPRSGRPSLMGLNDAADEFFDVSEPADCDNFENERSSGLTEEHSPVLSSHQN